jgi:hypothetical protein
MAIVPLSGTNIRLLSGVPFSNDYKHSRWFDFQSDQTNWFTAKPIVHSITQANFQRIDGTHFVAVDASIDDLRNVNYLMFQNAAYNNKWFYAFVTKVEYKQRNTTYVHFEIDVLQTWLFDMDFKKSFVEREHCKLWNSDGTPVVNTIDEGLNYGTEYDVVGAEMFVPTNGYLFLVIISKSTLHVADGYPDSNYIKSSMNGGIQPLSYYIHPFSVTGEVPAVKLGSTTYGIAELPDLINQLYKDTTAVNNVVSMYVTDHIGIHFDEITSLTVEPDLNVFQELKIVSLGSAGSGSLVNTVYVERSLAYTITTLSCGKKYLPFGGVYTSTLEFPDIKESKLLMYPYAFTQLDDFRGNRTILKNEYINDDEVRVDVMGSMGTTAKVAYAPKNYLTDGITSPVDRQSISLEHALIDSSPKDVAIVTDLLSAYIQGNKNSMLNQVNTIAFNGAMDVIGGAVSGIAGVQNAKSRAGMIGSAVSGGMNMIRGGGNAMLQLQGIQAKIKDINNMPPSLSKMNSNTAFQYGNGYYGFWRISKRIKPEYAKKLEDFFGMYGYKVNELKIPNFHTRQSWNYVQTISCNIQGNFNNEDLQELKNVFDNGVTLWHVDDVGNYSLSNEVL